MKKIQFALLLLLLTFAGWAQDNADNLPFVFGPMAGLNVSRLVTKVNSDGIYDFKSRDRVGFHAGFFARFPFKRWYVQPEIICSMKGGRGQYYLANDPRMDPIQYKQKVNIMAVDMPLLVGYNLGKTFLNFRIFTGPVIGYTMSEKIIIEPDGYYPPDTYNMNIKDAIWSWTGGLGLDVWKFSLDVRYERGLHDVSWNPDFKQVPSSFMFTVGLKTL